VISRTEPFAGTIVWAYDLDSDGNKTVLTESYRVTKPLSRIGWMIIEKGFGGHDRERDLRRGIHDTLDATKAAAESTQNLPPRTKTSHRVNRSGCATHIPPGTCTGSRSAFGIRTGRASTGCGQDHHLAMEGGSATIVKSWRRNPPAADQDQLLDFEGPNGSYRKRNQQPPRRCPCDQAYDRSDARAALEAASSLRPSR
jgi:hypothetical protein